MCIFLLILGMKSYNKIGRFSIKKGLFQERVKKLDKIFRINELVDLRLINNKTHIYIKNKPFIICAHLLINIPVGSIHSYDKIKSIDQTIELSKSTEKVQNMISPEEEFMGHCSNIQAFFENGLNTDILHTNIAFPLLKKLVEMNFEPARRVFKEEIIIRFNEGTKNSRFFLNSGGYLDYLNEEEKQALRGYDPYWFQRSDSPDFMYKIVILGDDNVGRSTLVLDYLNSRDYNPCSPIGVNFATKDIFLNNHSIRLQIWFLSNHKPYKNLFNLYLSGTLGAIMMYDITNFDSMNNIPKWIQAIKENKWIQARGDIPILLVGNKIDLKENRVVSKEDGIKIKKKYNLTEYMEISLKIGENVAKMFDGIIKLISLHQNSNS
ncbi:MAG: GTP-binding protein [Promethearchaeota archaeon]